MQFFQYPYIIITISVIALFIIGGVAIFFLLRGMKNSNDEEGNDFTSISKIEKCFIKSGKDRESRSIMYIGVSLDKYRSLYSDAATEKTYSTIKELLLSSFSPLKNGSIATYGEYTFVAYSTLDRKGIREIVDNFNASLTKCLIESNALNVAEVRIGASFVSGTDVSFDEAINRSKQACVLAKDKKILYSEWDMNSGKALEKKIKIENNIESEIDNNRFFLVYQPVIDAKTKEIIGAEALSRLNSSSDGILNPGSFLSAVDSVGLNNKFDYYIFEKNCKWISNDKKQRECYKYTINFSRETMCDPMFAERIIEIANKYGLNSSCLAVEILEDKAIAGDAKKQMMDNLASLKESGISILLDDFGSGYSTFDDLQNLDISIVKIDGVITRNAVTENGYIILENIIRTAKSIGFKTLCEGVETKEQEEAAIKAGCDLLQGFYYYEPMPAAMLEKLFTSEEATAKTVETADVAEAVETADVAEAVETAEGAEAVETAEVAEMAEQSENL